MTGERTGSATPLVAAAALDLRRDLAMALLSIGKESPV